MNKYKNQEKWTKEKSGRIDMKMSKAFADEFKISCRKSGTSYLDELRVPMQKTAENASTLKFREFRERIESDIKKVKDAIKTLVEDEYKENKRTTHSDLTDKMWDEIHLIVSNLYLTEEQANDFQDELKEFVNSIEKAQIKKNINKL